MERGERKIDLTFMFCNWYSGGTLFSIILNGSSDMVCNGEVFPWHDGGVDNDCSCGDTVSDCEFYNYCASEMRDAKGDFDLNVFRPLPKLSKNRVINRYLNSFFPSPIIKKLALKVSPTWSHKLKKFINSHIKFYEKALEFDKKSIYVDGSKNVRRAEFFVNRSDVNVKIIHLIRDGRGFCNSWVKNRGVDKERGLEMAARDWNNYILQVDEFSNRYPDVPVLTVRYEDLCKKLELQKERMQEFLSLTGEWKGMSDNHFHILGNRMRRSFSGVIQQDLSWQSELNSEQIKFIESIMKKQLERYGYV